MDQARKAGVPRDIVDRNLKRSQDKATAEVAEHLIEVYGPGGSGFVMDCLTDSKARAVSEIWTIVKKLNGKVLPPLAASLRSPRHMRCVQS